MLNMIANCIVMCDRYLYRNSKYCVTDDMFCDTDANRQQIYDLQGIVKAVKLKKCSISIFYSSDNPNSKQPTDNNLGKGVLLGR